MEPGIWTIEWDYEQKGLIKACLKHDGLICMFSTILKKLPGSSGYEPHLTVYNDDLAGTKRAAWRIMTSTSGTTTPKRKKSHPEKTLCVKRYELWLLCAFINEVNDPLTLSCEADIVEGFGNQEDRLNFRRMEVSSELSLNSKLFVEFVALITSYIRSRCRFDLFKSTIEVPRIN